VFIAVARWGSGVPATLNYVNFPSNNTSPLLIPYPNWELNTLGNCSGFTSVFRVMPDDCNRLWVIDSGLVGEENVCPPKVAAIDLSTDQIVYSLNIPQVCLLKFVLCS
jgi:hypothetical protein